MNPSYNNSFGGVQQPIMSSGGDVVLPNTGGEKKRWPIVVVICLVIVAIVLAIVFVLLPKIGGGKSGNLTMAQKYLNYVVNGDENNSDVGDGYSDKRMYYFNVAVDSEKTEDFDNFYNKANTLLDEIDKKNIGDDKKASISIQKDLLTMIKVWRELEEYNSDIVVMDLYLSGGRESIDKLIVTKVDSISFENDDHIKDYVDYMKMRINSVISLVDYYHAVGCNGETAEELSTCELTIEEERNGVTELEQSLVADDNGVIESVNEVRRQFIKEVYFLADNEVQNDVE